MRRAVLDSFVKLDPRLQARNPVMFIVEIGSVLTTFLFLRDIGRVSDATSVFGGLVAAFLWFTVLFANFAEAMAEGRGKAQADTLRKTRSETVAYVRQSTAAIVERLSSQLQVGDLCVVRPGTGHPRRRRRRRGDRLGRRVSHHRRIGTGDPRIGRRSVRRHRRHPGAVRRDRRQDHRPAPGRRSSTG